MVYDPVLLAQGLVLAVLLYIIRQLSLVRQHLATLNGRTGRLEEWRGGHVKQDDERHEETNKKIGNLFRRVNREEA